MSASVHGDSGPWLAPVREEDDEELVSGRLVAADAKDVRLPEFDVDRRAENRVANLPARLAPHALEGEVAELDLGALARRVEEEREAIAAAHGVSDALPLCPPDDDRVEPGEIGHIEELLELLADSADLLRDVRLVRRPRLLSRGLQERDGDVDGAERHVERPDGPRDLLDEHRRPPNGEGVEARLGDHGNGARIRKQRAH